MLNVVMNAMGKVQARQEGTGKKIDDTRKETGAGLDYITSVNKIRRGMGSTFVGVHCDDDKQVIQAITCYLKKINQCK